MKDRLNPMLMLAGVLILGGCATKKYVARTVDPVRDKLDTVASNTDKQGQQISQQGTELSRQGNAIQKQATDLEQAQTDISANKERAVSAEARAGEALQKARQNARDLAELRGAVANLDDYKPVGNTTVTFGFNQDIIATAAKTELDKLVSSTGPLQRYFITIEGFTDQTGTVAYNNQLSRRRAEAVMRYLVAKHDIPVYRIHMIGLGEDKPADAGSNRAARAKNRRAEVTIFTAEKLTATSAPPSR